MGTPRGLDRLIFFTDAVAAIAITLLILPLVDLVPEAGEAANAADFLGGIVPQLASFLISFLVIARLWIAHHAVFEHVEAYSRALMWLSLFWALTIVVLPLPTSMTAEFSAQPLVVGLYIGTMTLSSAALTAMSVLVHRSAALEAADHPLTRQALFASAATTLAFVDRLADRRAGPERQLLLAADPGARRSRRRSARAADRVGPPMRNPRRPRRRPPPGVGAPA